MTANCTEIGTAEKIKTFEDACDWCVANGESGLVKNYKDCWAKLAFCLEKDAIAFLQLRVITAALNEGWQPSFFEGGRPYYAPYYCPPTGEFEIMHESDGYRTYPRLLWLKSEELARYAAEQFGDLYKLLVY